MSRPRGNGGRYETLAVDDHDFDELQTVLTSDQFDLSSNTSQQQQGQRSDSLLQKRPSTHDDQEDYGDDDSDDSERYIYSSSDDDGNNNEKDYLPTSRRRRSNRGPYIETPIVRAPSSLLLASIELEPLVLN